MAQWSVAQWQWSLVAQWSSVAQWQWSVVVGGAVVVDGAVVVVVVVDAASQNTGSHTIVWTHENAAPLIGIDSAALATAVLLPSLSHKGQWNTDEKRKKSISNYIHSLSGIIGSSRLLSQLIWTIKAVRL